MDGDGGRCLGYVIRNPFNDKVEKAWLMPYTRFPRIFRRSSASFRREHILCPAELLHSFPYLEEGDGNRP